jgi:glycosyltransferase involved in cell wall biosynthesis
VASPDLSVVVPTYRGSGSLEELLDRLARTCDALQLDWEVVLVNDASPDDTWPAIELLADRYAGRIRGVDLLHNHGQAVATMCGMAHARGRRVATMDDDLQHPPEELAKLWAALDEHPEWDAVVGSWPRDQGIVREAGSLIHAWSDRLAHHTPKDFRYSAFRLMRRPVVDAMVARQTRTPVIGPLLTQTTNRIRNVAVRHDERAVGSSNFRLRHGLLAVTSNFAQGTTLPLQAMSWFGFAMSFASAILGLALLARYFASAYTAPGWLSVFLATIFFGGALLVQIGLLSQYVHLIIQEVRQPPRWDVRQVVDGSPAEVGQRLGEGAAGVIR